MNDNQNYLPRFSKNIIYFIAVLAVIFFSQISSAQDSFCGEPTIDNANEAGIYIWRDCTPTSRPNRQQWFIKVTAGGGSSAISYEGKVESAWTIQDLVETSFEGSDFAILDNISSARNIDFKMTVIEQGTDQIGFTVNKNSPSSQLILDQQGNHPVYAGPNKVLVSTPLNLKQEVSPAGYADAELDEYGYISVTEHGAVADDGIDDTSAIQATIDEAIPAGKNVYLPEGEWIVSDTLKGMMTASQDPITGKWTLDSRRKSTSIVGSTKGSNRPVLKLVPSDNSFNDDSTNESRKPVLWIYAQSLSSGVNSFFPDNTGPLTTPGSSDPIDHDPSISFAQVVRGVDFDLTSGNVKGAIAIRHPGSQGSSISDVKVELGDAYSAFDNPPGQGGGLYNVEVIGGQYAVTTNRDVRYPLIVGAKFIDQSKAAIQLNSFFSLVMTGFYIASDYQVNAIEIVGSLSAGSAGANNVSLVDGIFELNQSGSVAVNNIGDKSVYLDNVYFGGSTGYYLLSLQDPSKSKWYNVNNTYGFPRRASRVIYAGKQAVITSDDPAAVKTGPNQIIGTYAYVESPSVDSLLSNHIWTDSFPSFEDDDVVNVKIAGNSNLGSGSGDDTDHIQALIDTHQKIFLPKGIYNITKPLELKADTVLIGAGKNATVLRVVNDSWVQGDPIIKIDPSLTPTEAKDATTTLAHLLLTAKGLNGSDLRSNSYIDWTAGENSVVRDVAIATDEVGPPQPGSSLITNEPAITIRDTGGGKWYGLYGEWTQLRFNSTESGYRALKVENTVGKDQTLTMYGLNIERSLSSPQNEFTEAENLTLYSFKVEANSDSNNSTTDPLHINNSNNIRVIGLTGGAKPNENIVKVTESTNTRLINISSTRKTDVVGSKTFIWDDPSTTIIEPVIELESDKNGFLIE